MHEDIEQDGELNEFVSSLFLIHLITKSFQS